MYFIKASLLAVSATLAAGAAVADRATSILNGPAYVDQTYGSSVRADFGNLCGDIHDQENHSGDGDAAEAADCLSMLDKVAAAPRKAFYSLDSNWPQRDDIKNGFAPLMTVGTCTLSIRPTKFQEVSYAYFVGYSDVADILHSLINQYQKDGKFGASGYMPCDDKLVKHQGDYEVEFRFWDPKQ
ncbi:hypothetical protein KJ359_007210 [Pestalotiopsis sp. 9143b]|nr:hypothetical protein KJ359_007210 [Pestalotiopsis sp. 9143b]